MIPVRRSSESPHPYHIGTLEKRNSLFRALPQLNFQDVEKGLAIVFRFHGQSVSTSTTSVPHGENASEPRVIFALHLLLLLFIKYNFDFLSSVYYFRAHRQSAGQLCKDCRQCERPVVSEAAII